MRHQKLMRGGWVGEQTRRCERQAKRRTPQLVAPRFTPGASVVSASPPPPGELRLVGQDHSLPPAMFLTLYRIVGSRDRAGARNKTAWRECSRWQSNNGGGGREGRAGGGAGQTAQLKEGKARLNRPTSQTAHMKATPHPAPPPTDAARTNKKNGCASLSPPRPLARVPRAPRPTPPA